MNPEEKKKPHGGARLEKRPDAAPRRRKRSRPQLTRRQRILRIIFIVLTVIAAIIVVGTAAFLLLTAPPDVAPRPQTTTVVDEQGNEIEVEIPGLAAGRKRQFYTFLLVGQDTGGGGLTDTMMLAAYDVPNQTLNVMSLPRDTYVNYKGRRVLLNSIYNRAGGGERGMEALKEEVRELTGIFPDFHVTIQWAAVGELVDAIDGVSFDVPLDMDYEDPDQELWIHLKAGYQELDGDKAMQLLRWRKNNKMVNGKLVIYGGYPNGDLGRIETQQKFLTAVIEKCLQPTVLLPNLMEYVTIFQKNVETDLSIPEMAYFGKSAASGLDMSQVEFVTLPYKGAGDAHLLPVGSEIVELINQGFNPYDREISLRDLDLASADTPKPSARPTATPVPETPAVPSESPAAAESPETSGSPAVSESPSVSVPPVVRPTASAAPSESGAPVPTPPPATPTPAPTPAPPAPTEDIEYGPGMEPVA